MSCFRSLALLAVLGLLLAAAEAGRNRRFKRRSTSGRSCERQFRALAQVLDGSGATVASVMGKNRKNKRQTHRMIASCNDDEVLKATCNNGRVSYESLIGDGPSRPGLIESYAGPVVDPDWLEEQCQPQW
jgi:hypothetical protein